jgi:hypothetical protein
VYAFDPNDKSASAGEGGNQAIDPNRPILYTIRFENVSTATAPALEVLATDALSPRLDWSTVEAVQTGFGDLIETPEAGDLPLAMERLVDDYRDDLNQQWIVRTIAEIDRQSGVLSWRLRTLDPVTLDYPTDPLAGFLPPNDAYGRGQGFVSFSAKPKPGLTTGTVITNAAIIVFDAEAPITTNIVTHTIGGLTAQGSQSVTVGQIGYFTATAIDDGRLSYWWDFGDGGTITGAAVTHVYTQPGNYSATVIAAGGDATVSAVIGISVAELPLSRHKAYIPVIGR